MQSPTQNVPSPQQGGAGAGQQPGGMGQGGRGGEGGRGQGGRGGGRQRPAVPDNFKADPILKLDEAALIKILQKPDTSEAAVFEKAVAARQMAEIGTKAAVPALAALLGNEKLSDYARDGLEGIPDPAVDDALRAALPKYKGLYQIGIINSIGKRADAKALDTLARMMLGPDAAVASASAMAVGYIGGPGAVKALQDGLAKAKEPVRSEMANALLINAEAMMKAGNRKGALDLYHALSRPDMPKPVRVGAMNAIVVAETSTKRPRSTPTAAGASGSAPPPPPAKK